MTCVKPVPFRALGAHRVRRSRQLAAAWSMAALGAVLSATAWAQSGPQPRLPTTTLGAGMHKIVAELAVTPQQQATGMMMRREMGASEGMLFVNDTPGVRCFWMRNTLIPLTIAFVADDGRIVNLADMQPQSDQEHCSAEPVRFALEMRQGWFAKRNIRAGFKLSGPPFKP
jgi:uncharacterized membrane protein (UPF0127 family)